MSLFLIREFRGSDGSPVWSFCTIKVSLAYALFYFFLPRSRSGVIGPTLVGLCCISRYPCRQALNKDNFTLINCSWTKFIAIIVYVCLMQNFLVIFTPLTFCVLRDLKFSLYHNFKQLNSIGGNLILKVKWKVRRNWCLFFLTLNLNSGIC